MKTKNKIFESEAVEGMFLVLLLIIFLLAGIGICSCSAQPSAPGIYKGFEANYGIRVFKIQSNIPEISNLNVIAEGGNAGIMFGNDVMLTKIRPLGLYYSTDRIGQTVNLFEFEGLMNFHPFQINKYGNSAPVSPYIISGFAQCFVKLFGHYTEDPSKKTNYSTSYEPYVGRINVTTAIIGAGIDWKVKTPTYAERSFLSLYAEVKYGLPMLSNANNQILSNTSTQKFLSINVGVCFGEAR
jgi:hypothetical protein